MSSNDATRPGLVGSALAVGRGVQSLWLLALLLVVWEIAARLAGSLFIPPVSQIFVAFVDTWLSASPTSLFLSEQFRTDVLPSLARLGLGYGTAATVGICAGILIGVWRPAGAFFNPLIRLGMSVPVTALLPIAIVVFGITSGMNVFLIALGCLWPILINTYDGVRGLDRTAVTAAKSLRLTRRRYFLQVLLPGASPAIFAGLRISIGIALVLMVISELYAATAGLGFYIVNQQRLFRFPELWSAIVLLALLGILFNAIFALVERLLLGWHRNVRPDGAERH